MEQGGSVYCTDHLRPSFATAGERALPMQWQVKQAGVAAAGNTATKRKVKGVGEPKGPRSSFIFFSNAMRADVLAADPGLTFTDCARKVGVMWKALTADERAPFEKSAAADKERYREAMKSYVYVAPQSKPQQSETTAAHAYDTEARSIGRFDTVNYPSAAMMVASGAATLPGTMQPVPARPADWNVMTGLPRPVDKRTTEYKNWAKNHEAQQRQKFPYQSQQGPRQTHQTPTHNTIIPTAAPVTNQPTDAKNAEGVYKPLSAYTHYREQAIAMMFDASDSEIAASWSKLEKKVRT